VRNRPIDAYDSLCIQIDGVWIGEVCVALAVGIDNEAIRSAVRQYWSDALRQECLIHQERNVIKKLRKRDESELLGFFKTLLDA